MPEAKHPYPDVNPNPDFPTVERGVLEGWAKGGLFKKSVDNRANAEEFIFYDGPPFANGLPHYGHLLTGYVKDLFARYQTMRGKRVERRFGWDCHGLPAEMGSEKELGISGRAAIQNFGIDKFNEHCRTSVMRYTREWEDYVTRQARWVDFANDYKTMDVNFMESVLWAFKQLFDKGLVYEAHRVMPYSWAAETPLSNFETKLDNSYREREDKAVYVKFKLKEKPQGAPEAKNYYLIAWTTTPWTLPSNLALAVSEKGNVVYMAHLEHGDCYIASMDGINKSFGTTYTLLSIEHPISGKNIVGIKYEPLFGANSVWSQNSENIVFVEPGESASYTLDRKTGSITVTESLPNRKTINARKNIFSVLAADFVIEGDGTGVVHIAPGFGEDDHKLAVANDVPIFVPVDGQGKFTDEIFDVDGLSLKGLNVIAEPGGSKFGLANDRIIEHLKKTGQLIKQEQIKHNYPHCWRTDQPLIYRAMPSWYVEVTKFRDRAVELNKQINWIPEHIRDGQMGHMLATAPDWSISRNRFWGTPIPVWRSKSGKVKVCGSIAEIEALSGKKVKDLHRPYIDDITFVIDGETYTRVEDVFDCWFESGSMPFAQVHYPFENKEWFDTHFPADFITEYVGQTRGWFNTLIMLSTALFDKPPFKNCICHGVVLDSETGLKYSKRLKNYKDPMEVMDKFGADALRWLMISSPVMRGQDLSVDPEGKFIRDVVRLAIKPIWNAYNFFTLYANADDIEGKLITTSTNVLDQYILVKLERALENIKLALDNYNTPDACQTVLEFFDNLNNWYIRRSKERFWKTELDDSKQAAYDTLYTALHYMCRAGAPLMPLILDEIYKGLTGEKSVHLTEYPSLNTQSAQTNPNLENDMDLTKDICNAALSIRNNLNIRVRQPLSKMYFISETRNFPIGLGAIIGDEINVKEDSISQDLNKYATLKLSINSAILGKRLPAKMKEILPASKKGDWKQVDGAVVIGGEKLLPGEYTLQLEPKPEYANRAQPLSTNDALVILDTTLTPELIAEGIARDVVRAVQQARKDAGLDVSDRIALHIDAPADVLAAIDTHKGYIGEQTLTAQWLGKAASGFAAEVAIEDKKMTISLEKDKS